jgi:nucleoside-diphosphate-sugar epimerase
VYVTAVVQGLLLAADHAQAIGQAYNITHDQPLTQEEFLDAIAQELGGKAPRLHAPYPALYAAAFAAEHAARLTHAQRQPVVTRLGVKLFGTDNRHALDKARRELGYMPRVSLREGVQIAANWHRTTYLSGAAGIGLRPDPGTPKSRPFKWKRPDRSKADSGDVASGQISESDGERA